MRMQSFRSRQYGAGLWGTLFILAVIAFVALLMVKVVPIYLNQMKVAAVVKEVAQDPNIGSNASPHAIYDTLQRHWDIEDIEDIRPRNIAITRSDVGETLSYDYEARRHLFYNIYIVIHFEGQQTLRGGS